MMFGQRYPDPASIDVGRLGIFVSHGSSVSIVNREPGDVFSCFVSSFPKLGIFKEGSGTALPVQTISSRGSYT